MSLYHPKNVISPDFCGQQMNNERLLSMNYNAPAQVVETLKEKLNKLTPSAAEPALGCTSQSL